MIFLPAPDGDIAELVTFHDPIYADNQLYRYRTWWPTPEKEHVEQLLSALNTHCSSYMNAHYVIHQKNCSWIGQGLESYWVQLYNQDARYEEISGYEIDFYKNEVTCLIQPIQGENFIVVNIDPYTSGEIRHFELKLFQDGLSLQNPFNEKFLEDTGVSFHSGEPISFDGVTLSEAISGREVDIIKHITDEDGYVEKVVCENPLFQQEELVSRLVSPGSTAISDYKYLLADWDHYQNTSETGKIRYLTITDYNHVAREFGQNVEVAVSPIFE